MALPVLNEIEMRLAAHRPTALPPADVTRRAAVAIVLREPADPAASCDILFIRRAEHEEDPWSDQMAFPGGRVDPTDESTLAAACRETLEEVGLDLGLTARLLGQLDEGLASAGGRVLPLAITPFVFRLEGPVATRANHEVREIHWISLGQLTAPAAQATVPYTIGGERYELPCFRVNERIIWGLTYRMLMQLFAVLDLRL